MYLNFLFFRFTVFHSNTNLKNLSFVIEHNKQRAIYFTYLTKSNMDFQPKVTLLIFEKF